MTVKKFKVYVHDDSYVPKLDYDDGCPIVNVLIRFKLYTLNQYIYVNYVNENYYFFKNLNFNQ